ncbi:hypothetical protein L248_2843 [Schleiferilactobacillus shenzhenensis LY-73]|uniref:Uncharacterized protein n=1 Tax=Schleiferilactobacillus shenzhenensis LY-73 TaxID=1231336 RepID=U4TTF6_9LACO|nr:hypothetical protein L248_2843 [Schleiferilactobacillus shenzhenensis LY-73]
MIRIHCVFPPVIDCYCQGAIMRDWREKRMDLFVGKHGEI